MGCCFSCFNLSDNKSQSGEPNERTTLLGNPVSNSSSRPLFSPDFPEVVAGQFGDEQAALNKILQQTSIDIIDVSAIPNHIEQKDYIERVRLYQRKVFPVQVRNWRSDRKLLRDLPLPDKLLSENPLLLADVQMMNDAFLGAFHSYKRIEVEPQGDLVTKFAAS